MLSLSEWFITWQNPEWRSTVQILSKSLYVSYGSVCIHACIYLLPWMYARIYIYAIDRFAFSPLKYKVNYTQLSLGPSVLTHVGRLRGLVGSTLDHRSLPPELESWRGHIWRAFHLWLRFITFGGRSAHLAYDVYKSGRKTPIIVIIIIIINIYIGVCLEYLVVSIIFPINRFGP